MTMEEIMKQRVVELEKEIESLKKKLDKKTGTEAISIIVRIENAQYAINNLYICMGRYTASN